MPNKVLVQEFDGTPQQISFINTATFAPAAANDLRHASAADVECQINLTSVADAAARQSNKVDLGENRAEAYHVRCSFEFAATPVAGDVVELYWAPSQHSTAANGNGGNVSGADSAYTGYSSNLAASVKHLVFIGAFQVTAQATATIQKGEVGIFSPPERYGTLVVKNESGAAFHTAVVSTGVFFDPIVPEVQ